MTHTNEACEDGMHEGVMSLTPNAPTLHVSGFVS